MKNIIKSLLTLIMVMTVSFSFAQVNESAARKATENYKKQLGMTDDQTEKFYEAMIEMQKVTKNPASTQDEKKAAFKQNGAVLKGILTPEQFEKKRELDQAQKEREQQKKK